MVVAEFFALMALGKAVRDGCITLETSKHSNVFVVG
jgi:hypothetical protein